MRYCLKGKVSVFAFVSLATFTKGLLIQVALIFECPEIIIGNSQCIKNRGIACTLCSQDSHFKSKSPARNAASTLSKVAI